MTVEFIIDCVCEALELDKDKLHKTKKQNYWHGLYIAIWFIRKNIKVPTKGNNRDTRVIPYSHIAKLFERKQHGTIMSAEMMCKDLCQVDKLFKAKFDKVYKLIKEKDGRNEA